MRKQFNLMYSMYGIDMFPLPTDWKSKSLSILSPSPTCIYGLTYNIPELSYGFYLTNFTNLWSQELTREELIKTASGFGFEDASMGDLVSLINITSKGVSQEESLSFRKSDDNDELIECELKLDEINWVFKLQKSNQEELIQFLSRLNYQQFSNHSFLLHQIQDLKHVIGIKDTFIRFLVENFKQSHGLELINNYKRINRTDIESIERFNPERWERGNAISYKKSRSSMKKKSNEDELINNIDTSIKGCWKFANSFYQDIPEDKQEEEELSPVKFDALESVNSSPIKKKHDRGNDDSPNLSHSASPGPQSTSPFKKKLKIGALTSKRKSNSPSESPSTSPVKKKARIGALTRK
ncbi:uncharacterized protein J8A68_005868 [[Candida] subhashii]|uniref:XLF-like N-terminal domain-containing protein n=1 Tax=[Candida] subhashii TaxID=561895 RepID=A0A8J5UH23_9ASCO|nr:uncharacterized protein J8A68_005868 [[Candida] subhashii]KAG7660602.1 hypothetical protein J8A68_005868 [[Candida] subhashii]